MVVIITCRAFGPGYHSMQCIQYRQKAREGSICMTRRCSVCHCLGHNKQNCPSQEFGSGWVAFHEQFVPHPSGHGTSRPAHTKFSTNSQPSTTLPLKLTLRNCFRAGGWHADIGFRDRWSIEARGGGLSGVVEDLQGNVGKTKDAVGLDSIDFSELAG